MQPPCFGGTCVCYDELKSQGSEKREREKIQNKRNKNEQRKRNIKKSINP
jgi:hypothetical protein